MGKELLLLLKEKLAAFMRFLGAGLMTLLRRVRGWLRSISWSQWRMVLLALPVVLLVYILAGMAYFNRVDDAPYVVAAAQPALSSAPADADGAPATSMRSHTVDAVVHLIERETVENSWLVNAPFFHPGYYLDNGPNFQRGIISALSRVTIEMRDQIGRLRGSSGEDEDLVQAAGNLSREPDRWVIDFSTSLLPTTPSDTYYRQAAKDLRRYNDRLAAGDAVFDRRSDNLLAALDRMAQDLGASSAAIDGYVAENAGSFLPDTGADDLFYRIKGQNYAYMVVLTALKEDYSMVLRERDLLPLYDELLAALRQGNSLDPVMVINGDVDGVAANHLMVQGFYILRARTRLREVTNILLK